MGVKKTYQDISVGLTETDRIKLADISKQRGITRTVLARESIRWYLDHYEEIKGQTRESEIAQAIRYATDQIVKGMLKTADRICGMLARLGADVGTLYELTWRACGSEDAREEFRIAANTAKQRQRQRLENDEKAIVERTKKVITS